MFARRMKRKTKTKIRSMNFRAALYLPSVCSCTNAVEKKVRLGENSGKERGRRSLPRRNKVSAAAERANERFDDLLADAPRVLYTHADSHIACRLV